VKVECSACHRGSPPKYKGLEFSSCTSCHNDPHDGKLGPACESCHLESDWHQVTVGVRNHPWLSLANGHARTPCIKCHDRGTLRTPSRGRACAGCHKPVHEANFGKRCESCHEVILWLGLARSVGLNAHGKTVYPLRGKHLESPCAGCHKPSLPEAERYRQLEFDRCSRCHKDVHDARFAKRDDGECKACHSESGFRPSRFGVTLHHSTRFPLEGRHTAVACGKCHQHDPKRRERLDWSSKKLRCAECHENPHGDQFQAEMRRNGCATCHTPASWTLPRIDHSVWPLTGAHASTPCAACHTPTEQDRKAGAGPSYRLAPRACDGCHDDVHRGQFRLAEPKRACEFCHSTVEFKVPDFDHTRLTGYELLGKHKALKCDACHTHKPTPGGGKAALFRLGYRRCRDCHADPHAERKGTLASSSGGLP
ncbi:MAG TPA: hypothetical protein VFQ61_19550, partial [Polyangiaceae bacterium]|nr:hypothetical protein [Polyangiaceae bacterium]